MLKRVHEAQVLAYLKASQIAGRASNEFWRSHAEGGFKDGSFCDVPVSRVVVFVVPSCRRVVVVIVSVVVALILSHSASISSSVAPSNVRPFAGSWLPVG